MSEESIPYELKWCGFCGEHVTAVESVDHACFQVLAAERGVPAHTLRIDRPICNEDRVCSRCGEKKTHWLGSHLCADLQDPEDAHWERAPRGSSAAGQGWRLPVATYIPPWRMEPSVSPENVAGDEVIAQVVTNRTTQRIEASTWLQLEEIPADPRERRRLVAAKLQALGDALLAAMERE